MSVDEKRFKNRIGSRKSVHSMRNLAEMKMRDGGNISDNDDFNNVY